MRRIATHFVWFKQLYRMHYVELDAHNRWVGVFPLRQEIAKTEFYDGLLIPIPQSAEPLFREKLSAICRETTDWSEQGELFTWMNESGLWSQMETEGPVALYLLNCAALASAKFGTDNSRCNRYIQRL